MKTVTLRKAQRFNPYLAILLLGFFGLTVFAAPFVQAQERILKKRIAVITFEDKSDQSVSWGTHFRDAGDGMADMLTTALVESGRYVVLERSEIDRILQEQDLGVAGIVTPETAAQVGRTLGAEILVFGAVTEFGYKSKTTGGRFGGVSVGKKSSEATVAVDVRLVNATTTLIVAAKNVRETEKKSGFDVQVEDMGFEDLSQFDETLAGKATRKAINKTVELIDEHSPSIPWQGKVILAQNESVYINAGAVGGVQVGDRFQVIRPGEPLVDPDTGLELGTVETTVGEIQVVDNQVGNGKAAQCQSILGAAFQRGDIIRPINPAQLEQ